MNIQELKALFADLSTNEMFAKFIMELDRRFGAQHRTTFVPGDPYATAYNEGARSVIVFLNNLAKEVIEDANRSDDDYDRGVDRW